MNTLLYKCTDYSHAHLGLFSTQTNQFILGYITVYDVSNIEIPDEIDEDDSERVNEYFKEHCPRRRVLSFINVSSIKKHDFDIFHKCLRVDDPRPDAYTGAVWTPFEDHQQYFESICNLSDYRLITSEEASAYGRNSDIVTLYFAHSDIVRFISLSVKQPLSYRLKKINARTTSNLLDFFLADDEKELLNALAKGNFESVRQSYSIDFDKEQLEVVMKIAQALLTRLEKVDSYHNELINEKLKIEFILDTLL